MAYGKDRNYSRGSYGGGSGKHGENLDKMTYGSKKMGGKASEYPGRREHGPIDRGLETDANTPAVSREAPMVKPEKSKPHSGAA